MLTVTLFMASAEAGVEPYIAQSARVLTQLDHVHVGAETSFGASLGRLSGGFSAVYRPSGWSSSRLPYALPDGQRYKGQDTLLLGQHFGWFGLTLAVTPVEAGRFALDLPLTFGYGFLGTPMMGDDRDTPDGRRVSAWEDELLDGQDFTGAPLAEAGLRARVHPLQGSDLLGLFVAAHGTTLLGYEGPVASPRQLRGLSLSCGLSLGL